MCINQVSECPSWSTDPYSAIFVVVSFTNGIIHPIVSLREKDKSRIDQNSFDLWGMPQWERFLVAAADHYWCRSIEWLGPNYFKLSLGLCQQSVWWHWASVLICKPHKVLLLPFQQYSKAVCFLWGTHIGTIPLAAERQGENKRVLKVTCYLDAR